MCPKKSKKTKKNVGLEKTNVYDTDECDLVAIVLLRVCVFRS